MPSLRLFGPLVLSFALILIPVIAQQTPTTVPAIVQQSLTTLAPTGIASDITLTGTARRIAGSGDETGTGVFKALSNGSLRFDLSLPSGLAREVHSWSDSGPVGQWSGLDGILHTIPMHNLLSEPTWFFPTFVISTHQSSNFVFADLGSEIRGTQLVEHISIFQKLPIPEGFNAVPFQHLTQIDLYIATQTLLPVAVRYNIHPDVNAGLDIPVEVDFSDYRSVSGGQIPFHTQKYVNNTLALDFQVQNISLNSTISASDFVLQ